MLNRLSSFTFTIYSLASLILSLGFGIGLAFSQTYYPAIRGINQTLIRDWLKGPAWEDPLTAGWFMVLCAAALSLFINLAACTITKLLPRLHNRDRFRSALLLAVHLLLVLVMIGHGAAFFLGFKYEDIRLTPGRSLDLPNGLTVKLEEVRFTDDVALLKADQRSARRLFTRAAFHRRSNTARVLVSREGRKITGGEVRIIDPLKNGPLRLTLTGFFSQRQNSQDQIGVNLTVSSNPLSWFFFASYALLAGGCFLLVLAARRQEIKQVRRFPLSINSIYHPKV